ncbi:glycerol-3-phosphate responsive antiterminator [Halalkalibacter urbisdiaboli]|uniref:glycerol-3-phosphate responsive antiterminator n=1 Tax=Halalkalibacter urbisdiaboli TaxID=1960589 RepID=UPI000B430879|nr:glycerol-3-phosphate responsive antiterminator [Halalkalibacter urbisdiaboli]
MSYKNQQVLPAFREWKQLEAFLKSDYEYGVLLDSTLGQLRSIVEAIKKAEKKVILHVDLINGLKPNEHAVEFLCQEMKPAGIISTRAGAVQAAKKKKVDAIQRVFLLDSSAIETTYKLVPKVQPDYIELLPGVIPSLIKQVKQKTGVPILVGGLIDDEQAIINALQAGATAITTTNTALWKPY